MTTEALSARYDAKENVVVIFKPVATITVTPWIARLLTVVAEIDNSSVADAINSHLADDEYMVSGDARDFLPVSFWPLVENGAATDTQIACAAFDSGFQSLVDTPWGDVDHVDELPTTPDEAREVLWKWLGADTLPNDHLYATALDFALNSRFQDMGEIIRQILDRHEAAQQTEFKEHA